MSAGPQVGNLLVAARITLRDIKEDKIIGADRPIRLELLSRPGEQPWTDFGSRNVIVSDAVVHLWGLVGSEEERKALIYPGEDGSRRRQCRIDTVRFTL